MKNNKLVWGIVCILLIFSVSLTITSCSDDDSHDSKESNNEHVTIGEDGKASNGSVFSSIDDKNFYLDYIKYSVVEGHLEVAGYDKTGFKGDAKIVSSITYKGNFYEVLKIKDHAFSGCSELTSIIVPNSVTEIGFEVFHNCENLVSVIIGRNVRIIEGLYSFEGCDNLESIQVESGNTVYDSRDNCNAIIHTSTDELILGCKKTTIPNGVKTIHGDVFYKTTELTTIKIPNSVTSLTSFRYCYGLESIQVESGNSVYDSRNNCNAVIETSSNTLIAGCKNTIIPNTVTAIGQSAFQGCIGLHSITIPNSVTCIGHQSFDSSGLTSITIGSNVKDIYYYAFNNCYLKEVHFLGTTPPNVQESLGSINKSLITWYVPKGSIDAYKAKWGDYLNFVEE